MDDLTNFLNALPRGEVQFALEVRHLDWFRESYAAQLTTLLQQLGVGRVLLDSRPIYSGADDSQLQSERKKPKLPLQMSLTAPFSLIRFISHPTEEFNQTFLEEWVNFVDQWLRQGTRLYLFVHFARLRSARLTMHVTFNRCCHNRAYLYHLFLGTTSSNSPINSVCFESISIYLYILPVCTTKEFLTLFELPSLNKTSVVRQRCLYQFFR